jgi:hypothetical protein
MSTIAGIQPVFVDLFKVPRNRFDSQSGRIDSSESIHGLHIRLQIWALYIRGATGLLHFHGNPLTSCNVIRLFVKLYCLWQVGKSFFGYEYFREFEAKIGTAQNVV